MTDTYYEEEDFTTSGQNRRTLRRIAGLARPHWRWLVGFMVAVAGMAALDAYSTFVGKRIIDEGIVPKDWVALRHLAEIYGGIVLFQTVTVFSFIYLAVLMGERVRYDLRRTMFNHLQDLSLSYYSRTPIGWMMSRVTSDSERVSDLITWGLVDSTWAVFSIGSSAIFMLLIDVRLALLVLLIVPLLVWVAVQFRKRILSEFRQVRKINSKITGAYNENIQGVRVIKALGREARNAREFKGLADDMYRSAYRAAWLSALFLPVVQVISALAVGAVAYFGGLQAGAGNLTVGEIQAFVSYITFMMWPVQDLARVFSEMQQSIASAERMFSLIDQTPEVQDRPAAYDPGTLRGAIEFDHVSFHYEDGKPVLTDFNLTVAPGETIALVGPTGGGKSTIVNLAARFYEPTEGTIRIAGEDYTHFTLKAIQSRLGVVLQTPHLFRGTIRENLRYGRLDATDAQIEEAAKLVGAHDFILTLPKGYDENVGEGGGLLSTGQKQLISLARAVLVDPEIFIMDEATASVDTLTEALIQRGMEALMQGRTTFIIAHRLSTIRRADRILVIDGGRIAESGSHAALLRQRGAYYRLYTQQFRQQRAADLGLPALSGSAGAD
jgi:ATP-binding cassette subfamily B protein